MVFLTWKQNIDKIDGIALDVFYNKLSTSRPSRFNH